MAFPPQEREQNGRKGASFIRTNFKIRVPEVRVVDASGKMLGIMPTRKAQALAESQDLDLVEITPGAQPPVCKIMDYGKYRYEESIKQKQARKNAKATQVKEIKFHAGTDVGDVERKVKEILGFIDQGNKVKISLKFRGRENAHKELGTELIDRVLTMCGEKVTVEQAPKLLGRDLSCLIGPRSVKNAKKVVEGAASPGRSRPVTGLTPTFSHASGAAAPLTGLSRPLN